MHIGEALEKIAGYPDRADGWSRYLTHLRSVLLEDASGAKYEAEWIAAEKARGLPLLELVRNEERPPSAPVGDYAHLDANHSEAIFQKLLAKEGKVEADLTLAHGLSPWKLRIGRGMTLDTTASFVWLAHRLKLGSAAYFARVLSETRGQATT